MQQWLRPIRRDGPGTGWKSLWNHQLWGRLRLWRSVSSHAFGCADRHLQLLRAGELHGWGTAVRRARAGHGRQFVRNHGVWRSVLPRHSLPRIAGRRFYEPVQLLRRSRLRTGRQPCGCVGTGDGWRLLWHDAGIRKLRPGDHIPSCRRPGSVCGGAAAAGKAGAPVIILGSDLSGATSVTFNGTPASFTVASAAEITTAVPAGAHSGGIQVMTPGGTLASNVPFFVVP